MTTKHKLLVGVLVTAVAMLLLLFVGFVWAPASAPLPQPNGYDDFVKAGQGLSPTIAQFSEMDRDGVSDLVSANAEALQLVRLGLSRQCRAPHDSDPSKIPGLVNQLGGFKRLAQLLAAEGRLHELNNQPGAAARSYLDAIRFGNEMSRGGLLITRLVGIASESIGTQALARLAPGLSNPEARAAITELERIDANRVPWPEVLRSERDCARYYFRSHPNPITFVMAWWNTRQAFQKAEVRNKTVIAQERLLLGELGLMSYRSDKAHLPEQLGQLVPTYLGKVPQDPFSTRPLVYHPQSQTNWLLYSVGPDGVDDGGKSLNPGKPAKGDLLAGQSRG